MDITITKEQRDDMILALHMRINFIQTGEINMDAETAQKAGQGHKIKPLSDDQMRTILRMKDTINALYQITGNARLIQMQ